MTEIENSKLKYVIILNGTQRIAQFEDLDDAIEYAEMFSSGRYRYDIYQYADHEWLKVDFLRV